MSQWWVCVLVALLAFPALAQEPDEPEIPRHRLVLDNLTAVRYNPLGLQNYTTLSYRLRLMDSDSVLFSDTFFAIGPSVVLSPSFAKTGVAMTISPIALVELHAAYRYQKYFDTFDNVTGFQGPSSVWSDSAIEDKDAATAGGGHQVTLQWRVQAAYNIIALRSTSRYVYNNITLPAGDTAYYDQTPDMLVPNGGSIWVNDLDGMALLGKVRAGVRWTSTVPWYGNGEGAEGNNSHRIGPLATYTFHERPGSAFDEPTLILLAQWHVVHRFRTGEDVSAAIPYVALAFTFKSDLLPW